MKVLTCLVGKYLTKTLFSLFIIVALVSLLLIGIFPQGAISNSRLC